MSIRRRKMKKGTYKEGFVDCWNEVVNILKEAEKNPDDITRLSRGVETKLKQLKEYNHGCN
jgi:hypothetical protein